MMRFVIFATAFLWSYPSMAWFDPPTNISFSQALQALQATYAQGYNFTPGCYSYPTITIRNSTALEIYFNSQTIAGSTVPGIGSATFSGYISGTTLTITSAVSGTFAAAQYISGGSANVNTSVVSGSGTTWTVSPSQTVGSAGSPVAFTSRYPDWEVTQPFTSTANFAWDGNGLNIIATIPTGGGLRVGGINSGLIASQATYLPGATGANVYAFDTLAKMPAGQGAWSAVWFYSQTPDGSNLGAEIDLAEFPNTGTGNSVWSGNLHYAPSIGTNIYSIETGTPGSGTYSPGTVWTSGYHDYQEIWTPDAIYQYIDGLLINAQHYTWLPAGLVNPPQWLLTFGVGNSAPSMGGVVPNSTAEFPMKLSVKSMLLYVAQ